MNRPVTVLRQWLVAWQTGRGIEPIYEVVCQGLEDTLHRSTDCRLDAEPISSIRTLGYREVTGPRRALIDLKQKGEVARFYDPNFSGQVFAALICARTPAGCT